MNPRHMIALRNEKMRTAFSSGSSVKELAALFGVSEQRVIQLCQGRRIGGPRASKVHLAHCRRCQTFFVVTELRGAPPRLCRSCLDETSKFGHHAAVFFRANPGAPMHCEACGESRTIEVAHKPAYKREGGPKRYSSCLWPEKVWVLCPTCHSLIDRCGYGPSSLGLT